jgi:hypothetical protein|tara:strand:+ start:204 stop:329 length:126 start_codon:yes stop_codon:yes gene_type:complete
VVRREEEEDKSTKPTDEALPQKVIALAIIAIASSLFYSVTV